MCKQYLYNVHEIEGVHFQCVNNHYTKFEHKGMKRFTDYPNYACTQKVFPTDGWIDGQIERQC